jgi:PEP-CTERM motif
MNRLPLAFIAAFSALVYLVSEANSAPSLPGAPLGEGSYLLEVNADGTGYYVTLTASGGSIDLVSDPGVILDGFLAFELPEAVVAGDVALRTDNDATGAGLRFLEENGSYYMELFAPKSLGAGQADQTGFPGDFNSSVVSEFNEPQGHWDTFAYFAGATFPFSSPHMFYEGDAGTPEPSTWAMMLVGFVGLGFIRYRSAFRPF